MRKFVICYLLSVICSLVVSSGKVVCNWRISSGINNGFVGSIRRPVGNQVTYTSMFLAFYQHLSTNLNDLKSSVILFFIPTIHSTYNNNNNLNLFNYYLYTQEASV